jgi:hypothetical protein
MNRPAAALISCCSEKCGHATEAINLYTSALFKKSRAFAEKFGVPTWVLSAKYGLIAPRTIIAPYDVTLNSFSKEQLDQWNQDVAAQIRQQFGESPLLVLAGERYLGFSQHIPNKIIDPMKGLPIGKRLQWLNRKILSNQRG